VRGIGDRDRETKQGLSETGVISGGIIVVQE
jgi:hypothetical protein